MKYFVAIFILALLALRAEALELAWLPPTNGVPDGYVLFHGTNSANYFETWSCGSATNFTVPDASVPFGGNYFAVADFMVDEDGVLWMSAFSAECAVTNTPGLVLSSVVFSSTNLDQWQPWRTNHMIIMPNCPQQFFKAGSETITVTNIISSQGIMPAR